MPNNSTVTTEELREMARIDNIQVAVDNVKHALSIAYPNSVFMIVASDWHLAPTDGKPKNYQTAVHYGDNKKLSVETALMAYTTKWLFDIMTEAFLGNMVTIPPENVIFKEAAILRDAAIDYAKAINLNAAECKYCRDSQKWGDKLRAESDKTIHRIGQKVTPLALEQHITQVRQELHRLEAMRDPSTMHRMITDEIKRLRRKNEITAAKQLEAELADFEASLVRKQHQHDVRMQNFAKALVALEKWREKQREKKKKNRQQPNFAKMAKAKRQQIAARQAEKKKKKGTGSGDGQITSCSQLLNR